MEKFNIEIFEDYLNSRFLKSNYVDNVKTWSKFLSQKLEINLLEVNTEKSYSGSKKIIDGHTNKTYNSKKVKVI